MEIKDLSWRPYTTTRENSKFFPKNIKALIIGKTGSGKTNFLMHCLLCPGWLDYENLYVFCTSMTQPEYKILKAAFEQGLPKEAVNALFQNQEKIRKKNFDINELFTELRELFPNGTKINADFFEKSKDVPDPRAFPADAKNLVIFDDVMLEKQSNIESYYTRGRHHNIDCFYLTQDFFTIPKRTIRENTNLLCLFPQKKRNLGLIYTDYVGDDMPKDEFLRFCSRCWNKPYGFVVLNLDSPPDEGKYRCGLDEFYFPVRQY